VQPTAAPIDAAAVRDTIAAVFASPDFDRSLRETLLDQLWQWIVAGLRALREAADASPLLARLVYGGTILVVVALLARAVYVLGVGGRGDARRGGRGGHAAPGTLDAWRAAQDEAAAGRYTEAAHLLYRALLETVSRQEQVRLHPSKTVGDYVRDLRARRSAAFAPFREFARAYETVVYGLGTADRQRYEQLYALAEPLVAGARGGARP
jgi:hypothetical protein